MVFREGVELVMAQVEVVKVFKGAEGRREALQSVVREVQCLQGSEGG